MNELHEGRTDPRATRSTTPPTTLRSRHRCPSPTLPSTRLGGAQPVRERSWPRASSRSVWQLTIGAVVATRDDGDGGVRVRGTGKRPARSSAVAQITRRRQQPARLLRARRHRRADRGSPHPARSPRPTSSASRSSTTTRPGPDFSEVYACNPDLVGSDPAGRSPGLVQGRDDRCRRRRSASRPTLGNAPGVELVTATPEMFAIPPTPTIVVQSPSKFTPCDGDTAIPTPATTEVASPPVVSTVPPTLPTAGEQPTDPTTSHDAVVAAFAQAWDGSSSVEQRRAAMQASDQLAARARPGPLRERGDDRHHEGRRRRRHLRGRRTAPPSSSTWSSRPLDLPRSARVRGARRGVWKVSRETVCGVLQMAATGELPGELTGAAATSHALSS